MLFSKLMPEQADWWRARTDIVAYARQAFRAQVKVCG